MIPSWLKAVYELADVVTKAPLAALRRGAIRRAAKKRLSSNADIPAILNGVPIVLQDRHVTFEEIVSLAQVSRSATVTYRQPSRAGGTLLPGEWILAEPGVVFNASVTSRA